MKLILASLSPRRKEILENNNFIFDIIDSKYDEDFKSNNPKLLTKVLSKNKAMNVYKDNIDCIVLAADTVVYYKGEILGKPKDELEAKLTLQKLSNHIHKVITGYTIICKDKIINKAVTSYVKFNKLSNQDIDKYIASGLYKGKAGSYGIQDGFNLINKFIGDYDNIVGLPINHFKNKLRKLINEK